jgi:hypothetical protein
VTSLVAPADVRALVPTALVDADLQKVIDREEAALARAIGPLSGARTQTWYIGDPSPLWWDQAAFPGPNVAVWILSDRRGPLTLLRPTDAVTVTDNGVTVSGSDIRLLRRGTAVERGSGGWNGPVVTVAYTPNDALEVARVVIELCRETLTATGYQSETIGDYSYTKALRAAAGQADPRHELVRSLMTHLPRNTMRLRTQGEDGRIG